MDNGPRPEHPYHMHDAILAQPGAVVRAVERNEAAADDFGREAAPRRRLFLVGIGTSHHAALLGEHLFRLHGGGVEVRAVHSFDFALYGPDLTPEDCVVAVSHRGTKRYTAAALERARGAGCATTLVTGEGDAAGGADRVFRTVPQEKSPAHTVSFTTAVAVLALLAARVGERRTGSETLTAGLLGDTLPAALRTALGSEDGARRLAGGQLGRRRIWLLGGGPAAVTAAETAIKIRETSYLQAEGLPTETMLHGPFQCVEADDLFVLVAPGGAARERTLEVAGLAREVGSEVVVVDDGAGEAPEGVTRLSVPPLPEPFSALTCLVPLQFFSYHLALARGTNPDSFRNDDPRFARADVSARL
jgi:glucosamine--fructose-6-phosphate aminotransferase (isomerizing)